MSTVIDMFPKQINTKKKVIGIRLFISVLFFVFGLTMATRVYK